MSRLKYLKEKYGITQTQVQLATGIDQSDYSKIENNIHLISFTQCKELAILFRTSMDFIAELTDEEKPHTRTTKRIAPASSSETPTRLQSLRRKNNKTQKQVYEILNINQSNYSKMERGLRYMDFWHCRQLAILYHTSMDYLAELTDDESAYSSEK